MQTIGCIRKLVETHFSSAFKFGVVGAITAVIYFFVMWVQDDVKETAELLMLRLDRQQQALVAIGGRQSIQSAKLLLEAQVSLFIIFIYTQNTKLCSM